MKKISTIIMALVVVMTMAQCKKNNPTTPDNQNNVVTITLDVKNNNGSRVDVNTTTGTVDFETGDKVYVGSGGKYVGFLTHNGTNFVGNITNPTENQPLQFYFLGNVTPIETLSAGTTEECSVIISDQTEHLPVISCAASNENYVSGLTSYTGHLLNKCALVKFNVTTPSNSPICITGMKNKVTVDFTQNTMTPSMDGEGVIMLPAGSGENVEKWAILLPQEALEEGEEGSVYSEDGVFSGVRPVIPAFEINGYNSDGIGLSISNRTCPEGAIRGLFTIDSEHGNQVYFAKGNLQYIGSAITPYWKFADNQWEDFGSSSEQSSANPNVDRDRFCWATSGYNHGANLYQPWSINGNNSDYYAYGSEWYNLFHETGQADWGYNAIINGGNVENTWRTLRDIEWHVVFNYRSTNSGIRYAKAQVNNVNGVILLPDNWNANTYGLNYPNSNEAPYNCNVISILQWNVIEEAGAVFLPASDYSFQGEKTTGYYWSSETYDIYSNINRYVKFLEFDNSTINTDRYFPRSFAMAVRLVQDY